MDKNKSLNISSSAFTSNLIPNKKFFAQTYNQKKRALKRALFHWAISVLFTITPR